MKSHVSAQSIIFVVGINTTTNVVTVQMYMISFLCDTYFVNIAVCEKI